MLIKALKNFIFSMAMSAEPLKEEKQLQIPPTKNIEQKKTLTIKERIEEAIRLLNESDESPDILEYQMMAIEDQFSKEGVKIELFHKQVTELRNYRLYDKSLATFAGTQRTLKELAIYANSIKGLGKTYLLKNTPNQPSESEGYWRI